MTIADNRLKELPYCAARLGEPCNIEQIAERLIAQLKLNEGVQPNSGGGDWQAIAFARHENTNYEELVQQLPGCWREEECNEHWLAYSTLKLEARRLVEPRSK